jgi:phosphatidylglycerol:prolipoprotein diacylglycerol transferase
MGLAWGFGYFFTNSIFEKYNLDVSKIKSLFIGLFLSSWIGAKVFFLWFSSGPKIYQYIYANYFWLGGGFVFYGGLIFGLLFYFIWSVSLKKFEFRNSKYLLPGLIFGHAIGRVGCLLTGCCYGAKTNSFFSIYIQNEHRIPVQGFEALSLFIIGFVILKMLKDQKPNQFIIQSYLISYSIIRFFLEYFRGDEIRGVFFENTSTSQLISILIIITILIKKLFLKSEVT